MLQLKSIREIGLMRQAGLAVWKAHQIAAQMIAPGVTTAEIDEAVEEYFTKLGAEPLFKNYPNSDTRQTPFPAVTCMSVNEAVVHGIPDEPPLAGGRYPEHRYGLPAERLVRRCGRDLSGRSD